MENYQIGFNIVIEDERVKLLKEVLGEETPIEDQLALISKAAFEEYLKLFIGEKVFTRGSDIKEYRLFLLIKHVLKGRIPTEETVSRIFQLTTSESKSLIRSVMSKYQFEMRGIIGTTLKEVFFSAEQVQTDSGRLEKYHVDIKTENIVKEMNRVLGNIDGKLPSIIKERGTYSTYTIALESYKELNIYFNRR